MRRQLKRVCGPPELLHDFSWGSIVPSSWDYRGTDVSEVGASSEHDAAVGDPTIYCAD